MDWQRPTQVLKELRKLGLNAHEATRLAKVMDRVRRGEALPRETKYLRDGVWEIKFTAVKREIRLYYGKLEDDLVLLALHCHAKKKDLDKDAVDLAAERLRKHADGTWP